MDTVPSITEVTLGGLLQDIGKLMQRAHGSLREMDARVKERESVILPLDGRGGYTHKHALWTEAFFQRMEDESLRFPKDVSLDRVRDMAVFHHRPDSLGALGWLAAKADRYSSGMDRMARQEQDDTGEAKAWDRFRKTPMRCIFDLVDLGLGKPGEHVHALAELVPDERVLPISRDVNQESMPGAYKALWDGFWQQYRILCKADLSFALFEEALLGLLEQFTWTVPSSTVDIPDISLYDHSRTVAAIAAVLHRFHSIRGTLSDEREIKDDQAPKFRLLAGDLSGIQSTLFTLESQGARGVSKVLRARSFLLGALTEAAALRLLNALELPLSCLLQQAGGRFLCLVPDLDDVDRVVDSLQQEFDRWLLDRYTGGLSLNIALGTCFGGQSFKAERFVGTIDQLGEAIDERKQRPLSSIRQGVLRPRREYEHGVCPLCGIRPAESPADAESKERYCDTCGDEYRIGSALTTANFMVWARTVVSRPGDKVNVLGLELNLCRDAPARASSPALLSTRQFAGRRTTPWVWRYLANYVPRFRSDEETHGSIYKGYLDEAERPRPGDTKSFSLIAATAREPAGEGGYRGKAFLAVLKADVDRLGLIFAAGLRTGENRLTLSRFVQLSRMMDFFFTGYLQHLIETRFPETYTVYAGGDDLLLVGPWRQMIELAVELNDGFRAYTGRNPNITISAGVELVHLDMPINRAFEAAEERLDVAKASGRNRVCAIVDEALEWSRYQQCLRDDAEFIHAELNRIQAPASVSLVYRLLQLVDDAQWFEGDASRFKGDLFRANWRARLGYHLWRNVKDPARRDEWLRRLGFADPKEASIRMKTWRLPLSIALYRNRT